MDDSANGYACGWCLAHDSAYFITPHIPRHVMQTNKQASERHVPFKLSNEKRGMAATLVFIWSPFFSSCPLPLSLVIVFFSIPHFSSPTLCSVFSSQPHQ